MNTTSPKARSYFKRNSLPTSSRPLFLDEPTQPPKSCLKRNSLPSGTRPLFPDAPRGGDVFESDTDSTSDAGSSSHSCEPTGVGAGPPPAGVAPRSRSKSVSFCEEEDVCVFYPYTDPLHKQARKQAVRLFRACADALKIDSPYSPPSSRRGSVSSIEEEDEF